MGTTRPRRAFTLEPTLLGVPDGRQVNGKRGGPSAPGPPTRRTPWVPAPNSFPPGLPSERLRDSAVPVVRARPGAWRGNSIHTEADAVALDAPRPGRGMYTPGPNASCRDPEAGTTPGAEVGTGRVYLSNRPCLHLSPLSRAASRFLNYIP